MELRALEDIGEEGRFILINNKNFKPLAQISLCKLSRYNLLDAHLYKSMFYKKWIKFYKIKALTPIFYEITYFEDGKSLDSSWLEPFMNEWRAGNV